MFTAFASHRSIASLPLADKPCQLLPSSHPGDGELFPVRGRPAQWANTALARQLGAEETRWSGPGRSVSSPHSFCVNTKRDWADSSLVWSTKTVGCLARSHSARLSSVICKSVRAADPSAVCFQQWSSRCTPHAKVGTCKTAAWSCSPFSPAAFPPSSSSVCWQNPQSQLWECKWCSSSLSIGVCCPCPHLKTFPWHLLKVLGNVQGMSCKASTPAPCELWSGHLQLRAPQDTNSMCKKILIPSSGFQMLPNAGSEDTRALLVCQLSSSQLSTAFQPAFS